ncbi:MerR family transcriptional regulator [Lactobacillus sp. S2-2]|uniref:MerR family transcriptional regulator n=1 Tax=Lactobacillus sp. S2-2 TaxID=2692917 RepID=UPI001F1D5CD8|nr:MerR family transcriptional regulator [Lactobacillus sp. S2-2]MCF6514585.1 MerR family transcriptional regulator [Lactobacillus sp. S2-2]
MKISEIAEKTSLTEVTIRYYEKAGLIPPIPRKSGIRNYSNQDLGWIEFIKCMREAGLPVKSLLEYTNLFREKFDTKAERREILTEQLTELKNQSEIINNTINHLENKIQAYDDGLIN